MILTIKENCQTDNYGKFGEKLLPFSLISLTGKIMAGDGDFVSFFSTTGPVFCTEKLSWGGDFEKEKW